MFTTVNEEVAALERNSGARKRTSMSYVLDLRFDLKGSRRVTVRGDQALPVPIFKKSRRSLRDLNLSMVWKRSFRAPLREILRDNNVVLKTDFGLPSSWAIPRSLSA